jgi:hypothetical protein
MKSARKIRNFSKCARCHQSLIEINHYGERPIAFCDVQVWQASTSKCCRLAPEDIMALRSIKPRLVTAQTGKESPAIMFSAVYCAHDRQEEDETVRGKHSQQRYRIQMQHWISLGSLTQSERIGFRLRGRAPSLTLRGERSFA